MDSWQLHYSINSQIFRTIVLSQIQKPCLHQRYFKPTFWFRDVFQQSDWLKMNQSGNRKYILHQYKSYLTKLPKRLISDTIFLTKIVNQTSCLLQAFLKFSCHCGAIFRMIGALFRMIGTVSHSLPPCKNK